MTSPTPTSVLRTISDHAETANAWPTATDLGVSLGIAPAVLGRTILRAMRRDGLIRRERVGTGTRPEMEFLPTDQGYRRLRQADREEAAAV